MDSKELVLIDLPELTQEQFSSLDTLIMCSQGLYNTRLSEMRNKINELEELLLWPKLKLFPIKKIVMSHKFKIKCKCNNCGWDDGNATKEEKLVCKWQPIFEEIVTRHGLTFAPGKIKRCLVGITKLKMNKDIQTHLCSGRNGDWNINSVKHEPGFGGLFIFKPREVGKYISFVLEIHPPKQKDQ